MSTCRSALARALTPILGVFSSAAMAGLPNISSDPAISAIIALLLMIIRGMITLRFSHYRSTTGQELQGKFGPLAAAYQGRGQGRSTGFQPVSNLLYRDR